MKIVIKLPDAMANPDVAGLTEDKVTQIMRDALGEFIISRIPMREYVNKRYPGFSEVYQEKKLAEVEERIVLAALINSGSIQLKP